MSTIETNPAFLCPITQDIMTDPVIRPDGHTYERTAIESWLNSGHNRSPMTREPMTSRNLIPNIALRNLIQESQNPTIVAPLQQTMANYNNASSGCFLGDSMVRMVDGKYMKIDCLEQDDIVWGGYIVKCLVKFVVSSCEIVILGKTGNCKITPWHPIKMGEKWVYPIDVGKKEIVETKCYYNFVLNSGHILDVDGVQACTLGHDFTGPVIEHSYFGKKVNGVHNIMQDLMGSSGWYQGHIIWRDVQYIRDPITNLVVGVIKT